MCRGGKRFMKIRGFFNEFTSFLPIKVDCCEFLYPLLGSYDPQILKPIMKIIIATIHHNRQSF